MRLCEDVVPGQKWDGPTGRGADPVQCSRRRGKGTARSHKEITKPGRHVSVPLHQESAEHQNPMSRVERVMRPGGTARVESRCREDARYVPWKTATRADRRRNAGGRGADIQGGLAARDGRQADGRGKENREIIWRGELSVGCWRRPTE